MRSAATRVTRSAADATEAPAAPARLSQACWKSYSVTIITLILALAGSAVHVTQVEGASGNTWTTAAPLPTGRWNLVAATAAGKIYLFGGFGCAGEGCTTVGVYDPRTNAWTAQGKSPAGSLDSAATGSDGRVYLCCGTVPGRNATSPPGATMLVYDPRARTWTHYGPPPNIAGSAQLVTGRDGRIYAVGGAVYASPVPSRALSAFSLRTHHWTALAPLPSPQTGFGTAVGPDGRIYVIGGDETGTSAKMNQVDAYDPKTNVWSSVAPLPTARGDLKAVTGRDGRIYAIGGGTGSRCFTSPCNVVETYDGRTGIWKAVTDEPHPRWYFAAVLGPDGRIYVLGGYNSLRSQGLPALLRTVDVYAPVPANQALPAPPRRPASATTELAPMPTGRENLGVVTEADGKLYAIGGQQIHVPRVATRGTATQPPKVKVLGTVELYDPKANSWTAGPPLPAPRQSVGVASGPDGRIYVLGGVAVSYPHFSKSGYLSGLRTVFIYDPTTHLWSKGAPMPDGRYQLAAVTGHNGLIYTIGGATQCRADGILSAKIAARARPQPDAVSLPFGGCAGTRTVRSFDPRTGVWTTLAPLLKDRMAPAATVGADGRIYVFGGEIIGNPSARFEIYDPRSNHWSWGPKAPDLRVGGFAAATSADGRIDLIGGCLEVEVHAGGGTALCTPPSPVDAYDPRTNRWATLGLTLNVRSGLAATTGPDGRVYAVGGQGDGDGRLLEVVRLRHVHGGSGNA